MSSLSAQLATIAQNNASVALDRKSRHKLHSASLIYDAKTAATQDYDLIYTLGLEGLEELETIDRRFGRFKLSLFSETAVQVDRNVQTKEEVAALDAGIETFLALAGPYLHLAPAIKATEWLLRRFQINIHNKEALLLAALPHYATQLFVKVLHVVKELPLLFLWLDGYKKSLKNPTRVSMVKGFLNVEFFQLYSDFLNGQMKKHNEYSLQLVFYVSCAISLTASLAQDLPRLNEVYMPIILETAGHMLLPKTSNDCKIAAHSVLSVLAAVAPLGDALIASITDSLFAGFADMDVSIQKSALVCAGKLTSTLTADLDAALLTKLKPQFLVENVDLVTEIAANHKIHDFLFQYARLLIATKQLAYLPQVLDYVQLNAFQVKKIVQELTTVLDAEDKTPLIAVFESLVAHSGFAAALTASNLALTDLEMALTCTLTSEETAVVFDTEEPLEEDEETTEVFAASATPSFITSTDHAEFRVLVNTYVRAVAAKTTNAFFKQSFVSPAASLSFLVRVAAASAAPMPARLVAMRLVRMRTRDLPAHYALHLLIPFAVTLCAHANQTMRQMAVDILRAIAARDPKAKDLFLFAEIYADKDVAIISPADGQLLAQKLLAHADEVALDQQQVYKSAAAAFAEKKTGKLAYAFFTSQALAATLPAVKAKLIHVLSVCSVKGAAAPSQLLAPFLATYVAERAAWEAACAVSKFSLTDLDTEVVGIVGEREKHENAIAFLVAALEASSEQLAETAAARVVAIFGTLKPEFQQKLAETIVQHAANDATIEYDAVGTLQALNLDNKTFVGLFQGCQLNQTMPAGVAKRRRRSSTATKQAMKDTEVSKIASDHLKKVTVLLELVERSQGPQDSPALLQALFSILADLETLGSDGNMPVLYAQETLAASMLKVVGGLKGQNFVFDLNSIRADVIVATIRASPSPQVQNRLLLVVAALAALAPEIVLHSVMPIFTFMGAHTIRQDDEFSAHVVEQTIMCVVPALAATAVHGRVEEIEFLLTSFASAFAHIPRHRRVRLFTTLATTLGVQHTVHLILFLTGQQYAAAITKHKAAEARALVEFAAAFVQTFSVEQQLTALTGYVRVWQQVPAHAVERDSARAAELSSRPIFGAIATATTAELGALRASLVTFIDLAVTAEHNAVPSLRLKIASILLDMRSSDEQLEHISAAFRDVIQLLLAVVDTEDVVSDALFKLLGNTLNLLPIGHFVESISKLLTDTSADARTLRHVTVLAGTKFDAESAEDANAQASANALLPILNEMVQAQCAAELAQAALDTAALLIAKFGASIDAAMLTATLSVTTATLSSPVPEIVIGALNVVTSLVSVLGVKMIGFFPKIVPPAFRIFEDSLVLSDDSDSKQLLQTLTVVLFSCLVRRIPAFMTSNLDQTFTLVLRASTISEKTRASILDVIVQHMDVKTVMKSLCSIWNTVRVMDPIAIGLFLHAMEFTIKSMDKKAAAAQATSFVKFMLHAFEFRNESELDNNSVHRIEASVFQCGIEYVMKLNDKTFRPLFANMVRWAVNGEGSKTGISEIHRLLAFFRFFNKLQESLKSIVTSYYSYILESVDKILVRFVSGDLDDINLRRIIIISLTSSFKYDQDEFWQQQSRFEVVLQALTSQCTNIEDGIGKYLVKAISALAQNCTADEHNKKMNELLLSHMRLNCGAREKFWATRAMKMVYQKVGENWLSLLPQLVPIIAELLEDDDEEVEMEVRGGLVRVIESVLGEPLDRYLD
ncbi:hypothetical protein BABINDRAFT_160414 [Babjeviella inositovora NRRL Y-12698]|uniref:U3 small nucleolar RNA-associated protein 10 n=1 Tax=Babjeviella inositovora NRRL Y-12698 TaxID=984486 RepID=A0A1E3QTH5_9ASCO|nr:uncharacterized protein BABINDRAFT_160414 [Babjeviella inositovora NRRL Y-12698]ODQ80991.1 hypothetical protein BABINDRAFT_160414 [Babjeviella inositovora NRRL Y-12698]